MVVNVIVTQHHRRPSTRISHKPVRVVLGYIVDSFGSFWLVLLVVLAGFGWFRVLVTANIVTNYATKNASHVSKQGFRIFEHSVHRGKAARV